MKTYQRGFGLVEIVLVVVVLVLLGILGWKAWELTQTPATEDASNTSQTSSTEDTVGDITTESDLDKADAALDSHDIEGNELKDIENQTNF